MNHKRPPWIILIGLSAIGLAVWFYFSFPQLSFINLSIGRPQAIKIAKDYLEGQADDVDHFKIAAVFKIDSKTNRYLQKSIGFEKLTKFVKDHELDIFYWRVRFFQEKEAEEYNFDISSSTGEVISYHHTLRPSEVRETIDRDTAQKQAIEFLAAKFNFNPQGYTLKADLQSVSEYRTEYTFSWIRKDVKIPWSEDVDQGTGKISIAAQISGNEIISFVKNTFSVPSQFNRDLAQKKNISSNIGVLTNIFHHLLFIAAIFLIIVRRNHLAMHTVKKFYLGIMAVSFVLSLLTFLNQFQHVLITYKTTADFLDSLWRLGFHTTITALFLTVAIMMPGLSGELLHYEVLKDRREGSFLHYIRSTFFSRSVCRCIVLGYFAFFIMLGVQAVLIQTGQQYLGVWTEYSWITNLTTSYVPILAAFALGFKASFTEEIMYRLFAICWLQKILSKIWPHRNVALIASAIGASLIWGLGHSHYPVFPMWFRGLEVTCLGLLLSYFYLRYGIITVIVAHYLFDVFWHSAGYLFGSVTPLYTFSALVVLLLPLGFAFLALLINKTEEEKSMRWRLNQHQTYNLEVLKNYLQQNSDQYREKSAEELSKEITSHGWDIAVVEIAVDDFKNTRL